MGATVFVVDSENRLTELSQSGFVTEDLFQGLLGDHPALLRHASGSTGRVMLVCREAAVPEAQDTAGRWSLDHLFLDGDGVPVLVEVKRATDTRARREVVAQMLDYAANGVAYWSIDQLLAAYKRTAEAEGVDPDTKLIEFTGGQEPEAFWRQVEANLGSGRIRMVFVADKIPKELRRIVEFLNEQMRPAEVIAIEVEQFVGADGLRLLTPRIIGATERAASAKSVGASRPAIAADDWLATLDDAIGEEAARGARRVVGWLRDQGFITGVTATQDALFARLVRPDGKPTWPFFVRRSTGKVETSLQYLKENPAFASDEARAALLARLKALPRQSISTTKLTGWPAVSLADLLQEDVWSGFTAIALEVQERTAAEAQDGAPPSESGVAGP
jgi:hypothetical protein